MQSIFLLGSERSGSNLIRTLLGNHTQIAAPIAPHLCLSFQRNFKNYKTDEGFNNKIELLEDIQQLVNITFHDWNIEFNKPNESQKLESFIDYVHFVYSEYALKHEKSAYFSKDNNNHDFALGILKDIPKAKFIYLYRDPRDQVASWMRTPIHIHTPYVAIRKWKEEQTKILELKDFYKVDMYFLKYENLVDNPEKEMSELLNYLELPIESACFSTNPNNKEAEKHPLWQNINKPVKKKNYGKYMDVLTRDDVEMIETLTKNIMKELGYESTSNMNWDYGNRFLFRLKELYKREKSQRFNKVLKEKKMQIHVEKKEFMKNLFLKFKS